MSEKDIKLIEEMKDNCVKQANYVDVKAMDKYNALRNLQQENHDLKEQVECLIKQRDDISANAVETIEKYQQENKYLKLTNPEQNIEHFRIVKENKFKIDNLRKQNKELKAKLKIKEILCFNMPKGVDIICLTKSDYERNKSEYETLDKYKNIVSNAMHFINCNATDFDDGRWILELNELKLLELESILRGEK